jgi:hypothetical protein
MTMASAGAKSEVAPPALRRFTLADGLVLIAATALALAIARAYPAPYIHGNRFGSGPAKTMLGQVLDWLMLWMSHAVPFLLLYSLAVVILRFRPPRQSLRTLILQPGFAGLLAVAIIFSLHVMTRYFGVVLGLLCLPGFGIRLPSPPFVSLQPWYNSPGWGEVAFSVMVKSVPFETAPAAMGAIVAVWTVLYFARVAQPERSWVDRAGRFLGWIWIVFAVAFSVISYVQAHTF